MSTKREEYVILGLDIGYNKYDEDSWEKYKKYLRVKQPGQLIYLIDGMNGQYFIVGEVLAYGDEYEGFRKTFELDFDFSSEKINNSIEVVERLLQENFNIKAKPKILVLTHWS